MAERRKTMKKTKEQPVLANYTTLNHVLKSGRVIVGNMKLNCTGSVLDTID